MIDRIKWRLLPSGLSTAEHAAGRIAYLATSKTVEGRSGAYFVENSPQDLVGVARDPELALGLWRKSLAWTKLDPS